MNKRLEFLESLLLATGTNKSQLAKIMGVSAQNIFTYFQRDDMKLSYAQEIASRLGFKLGFTLEKDGAPSSSATLMDIEGLVNANGLSRLAFLRVAMGQYGIQRKDLAEKLGLNYTGVNRWFKVDDISISYIYEIAKFYGLEVKVNLKQNRLG